MRPLSQWMEMAYTRNNRLPEALAQASSKVHRPVDDASQGLVRWHIKMWLGSAGSWVRCRDVCCRDLAERSSCRDLAQRFLLESLSRDLVEDFWQRSYQGISPAETLCRYLAKRPPIEALYKKILYRYFCQRSCQEMFCGEILPRYC